MANELQRTMRSGAMMLGSLGGALAIVILAGCGRPGGYSNESLFPDDVKNVCVEMFDNRSFRRGVEYTLSDALVKRVESETPYKIVSDRDRADSVMTGQLVSISESILTLERDIGRALEKEIVLRAVVNWKSLKTGRLMIDNKTITAAASYSEFLNQDFTYASAVAANKLAEKIVAAMEDNW